jgi:hypothetical protein
MIAVATQRIALIQLKNKARNNNSAGLGQFIGQA